MARANIIVIAVLDIGCCTVFKYVLLCNVIQCAGVSLRNTVVAICSYFFAPLIPEINAQ